MTELAMGAAFLPATGVDVELGDFPEALPSRPARSRYDNVSAIRRSLQARRQRGQFFNMRLFSDPAWDMLLELYVAALTQRKLTVSRLSERSLTPLTTTLRWIAALEAEGIAKREVNPLDRRQIFIILTNRAVVLINSYFEEIPIETALL